MSQTETGKATAADERTEAARSFVRTVKAATRRKYTPEEKIRIVLEGFRREVTVSDLCRREGIKPHSYYSWTKEFMEAGKERLTRDSVRDATREEVHQLKRENGELKQLVADLSLEVYRLKKTSISNASRRRQYQRMSGAEKAEALTKVASSGLPKRRALGELGVPRSTYYRWLRREGQQRLEDDTGGGNPPWNKLTSKEDRLRSVGSQGDAGTELPAVGRMDRRQHGLLRIRVYGLSHPTQGGAGEEGWRCELAAGKECHRKTTGPHQMWATDASYFRVVGWGYYYMVTVMDDYSRFILGPQASEGYDIRLLHRSGPGGRGQDRHKPDPDRRPDQAAERQRPRLCFKSLQGLPGHGGHQAHTGNALPPSDQRQAGALPPDPQA